jgi:hypothetical protein
MRDAMHELAETGAITGIAEPGLFGEMTTLLGVKAAMELGKKYEG